MKCFWLKCSDHKRCEAFGSCVADHQKGGRTWPTEPAKIDYLVMPELDLLNILGDDASRWAAAFCQIAKTKGLEIDEGWMITWFANAIEQSADVRRWRSEPPTKPILAKPFPI